MRVKATARNLRIPPRKARLVIDCIRGLKAELALFRLNNIPNRVARDIVKILKSAIANADQKGSSVDELKVHLAYVNEGATLKRFRPRAMGRAFPIRKRTSHITIVVGE